MITLEKSKEFAVGIVLELADEFEARALEAKAAGKDFDGFAYASIRARDVAYRIGGTHSWGKRIDQ